MSRKAKHNVDAGIKMLSNGRGVILAIDDDPQVLAELTRTLNGAGHTCHCCTTADTALAIAKSLDPDMIILDVNLGFSSGLELCSQLQQEKGLEQVPVLFLTAAQAPDIIRRSHAAGGAYYLRKPFDPEVLVELVGKALWMPHLVTSHLKYHREEPLASGPSRPLGLRRRDARSSSTH